MSAVIRLDRRDNVAVAARPLVAGEAIEIDDISLTVPQPIALGHKIALVALRADDKVFKFGMPIGSMTANAAAGDWVHIHNMQSNYIPAHQRDAVGGVV
jgi:hypothetical protein